MISATLLNQFSRLVVFACLLLPVSAQAATKKVYADYHAYRYSRPHDGKLGIWKFSSSAPQSQVPDTYVNWNADLVDGEGRHEIASFSYPLAGMQSTLDPDYLEYQVLLAKGANIDGFLVEWAFQENEADGTLRALQEVASRYNFEIGVNWVDANTFAWLPFQGPKLSDRAEQVEYLKTSYEYLVRDVYGSGTGALVDGHPLVLLFGGPGGFTTAEFQDVVASLEELPAGVADPHVMTRAPIGPVSEGATELRYWETEWHSVSDGPFGWVPPFTRPGGTVHPYWDGYATPEDGVEYVEAQVASFARYADVFDLRVASVSPAFDNRPCASWGAWKLDGRERADGASYGLMWDAVNAARDAIDVVVIVTWNDFTESTHIEPTVEEGLRELERTRVEAAEFKGTPPGDADLGLPLRILELRKAAEWYAPVADAAAYLEQHCDAAALAFSAGDHGTARGNVERAERLVRGLEEQTLSESGTAVLLGPETAIGGGIAVNVDDALAAKLQPGRYRAWLHFDYLDAAAGALRVRSASNRPAPFDIVCDLKLDGTGAWRPARVRVFPENSSFDGSGPAGSDLYFTGPGAVRDVRLEYSIATFPTTDTLQAGWRVR